MKRLTKRYASHIAVVCDNCKEKGSYCDTSVCCDVMRNRLAEYEDAEEQGLLVRLPCRLGGDAYFVNEATGEVCEAVVTNIELNCHTPSRVWLEIRYVSKLIGKQGYYHCADKLIGKKLFFTRKEAEKALEEINNAK